MIHTAPARDVIDVLVVWLLSSHCASTPGIARLSRRGTTDEGVLARAPILPTNVRPKTCPEKSRGAQQTTHACLRRVLSQCFARCQSLLSEPVLGLTEFGYKSGLFPAEEEEKKSVRHVNFMVRFRRCRWCSLWEICSHFDSTELSLVLSEPDLLEACVGLSHAASASDERAFVLVLRGRRNVLAHCTQPKWRLVKWGNLWTDVCMGNLR